MKKVFGWILRIACFLVIIAALVTVARCVIHMNDDHSYEAVMGHPRPTAAPVEETAQVSDAPVVVDTQEPDSAVPTVRLETDGTASADHPSVTVTATFSDISSSLSADLNWYVDGELVESLEDRLLVDGSTSIITVDVDVQNTLEDELVVELSILCDDQELRDGTIITIERPETVSTPENEEVLSIRTEEITVTCTESCGIYSDSALQTSAGVRMEAGDTGLLLNYERDSTGLDSLQLQFDDGSSGWVSGSSCSITEQDCTTEEDYTEEQKLQFIDYMGYESNTDYLIWVSLYTQKVNVFQGEKGSWELVQTFSCATGVNRTPTTTGVYSVRSKDGHWDLAGGTYVDPVVVFNGGEAFTSQPKSSASGAVTDDTIGKPASGGSVRLQDADIRWINDNIPVSTIVIVY